MSARRVLVITTDPLTSQMPGPAIRAWNLAEVLAAEHQVTLASSVASDRRHAAFEVRFADAGGMGDLAAGADVVVGPGSVVRRYPGIASSEVPLVIDIYDPYQLENLEPGGSADLAEQSANLSHLSSVVREDLARGDFFLCASTRQRDFWLGSLAALDRLNPYTYAQDPSLRRLVEVVPFGLPSTPPVRRGPGLRERFEGIGPADKVVVWGGGVYNWFDPGSLLRAVAEVRDGRPDLRLVFLGMRHPNPHIPEMRAASEVRKLAERLGLIGRHVFFNDGWVPYDERADFLLDADLGVSTHRDHIEARFSFRTRVLDYLWAGLPMLLTEGDTLAEMVAGAGAGRTVPAGDVEAIAAALVELLDDPPGPEAVAGLAAKFHWADVAAPLLEFCSDPRPAPDRHPGPSSAARSRLVLSLLPMVDASSSPPRQESDLSGDDAAYLARVRGALLRLGARAEGDDQGVAAALVDLEDAVQVDAQVPVESPRREVALVKRVLRKLVRWYLRYLAEQTTALGQATLGVGRALAERADRLDDTAAGLVEELARLRERVERLERRGPG